MVRKSALRGQVSSMLTTIQFWMGTFMFLVIVCALIAIAFVLTISLEVSAVWDKIKTRLERKAKNG